MKKIILSISLISSLSFATKGFKGDPGEESQSILNQNIDAIFLATNGAGVSDDFLNQEQLAILNEKENVEISIRPGLEDEIFTSLWWSLPIERFQLSSQIKIYDRGEINRYDSQGTQLSGNDQPMTVSYGQGLGYQIDPNQIVSTRVGLSYEHLSHSQLTRSSAAYFIDLGWVSSKQNIGYGLLIKNLGGEFISSRVEDGDVNSLNTTIQAGFHFRMVSISRLKWNFDYQIAAYHQPSLLASLDFQFNKNLQGFLSTQLTHERKVNLWRTLRSQSLRDETDIKPLVGTGAKLNWESWNCEAGLAYTPAIAQVDLALAIGKNW